MVKTICFTGHRWLPKGTEEWVFGQLLKHIQRAVNKGYLKYISGGAIGFDQMAAKCVILSKAFDSRIELIIARPFPSQDRTWPPHIKVKFKEILDAADDVVDVSEDPYSVAKMHKRNEWMVDRAHAVIGGWNGQRKGGTYNCIEYTKSKGKPILIINPITKEVQWEMEKVDETIAMSKRMR